jgi:hypothetical protein
MADRDAAAESGHARHVHSATASPLKDENCEIRDLDFTKSGICQSVLGSFRPDALGTVFSAPFRVRRMRRPFPPRLGFK